MCAAGCLVAAPTAQTLTHAACLQVVIVFITAILLLHHETQVQWYRAGLLGGGERSWGGAAGWLVAAACPAPCLTRHAAPRRAVEVPTLPCSKTSFAVFAAVILGVTMAAVVWFVVVM